VTWVRRDDQASIHRKVAPLDDATYRLWSEAMEWCSRNGTDGRIGADELTEIKRGTEPRAAKLVARNLWHQAGYQCDSDKCPPAGPDGWVIHDYLDYNPTKAQVKAELAAKAERTRRWRERKGGNASGDASQKASRDGDGDASRDAPVTLPRPAPPRPEGSGAGDPPRAPTARRTAADAAGGGRPKSNGGHPDDDPENPDWRTRPAFGAERDPQDADRARVGAAAARAAIKGRPAPPRRDALAELRALTDPPEGADRA